MSETETLSKTVYPSIQVITCIYIYIYVYIKVSRYMQISSSLHYTQGDMGVPEYLSKRVGIRATLRQIRKYELMKLSMPFVSSMYADCCFQYCYSGNSLPDELRIISSFVTFKCRLYSHMLSL